MKTLSIRQPWASLIVHGFKPIENRTWKHLPYYRGTIFIHASSGMTKDELESCAAFCESIMTPEEYDRAVKLGIFLSKKERKDLGGIIGTAEFRRIVTESDSPWFFGKQGLILEDAKPLPFRPFKGQLGFFEVPEVKELSRDAEIVASCLFAFGEKHSVTFRRPHIIHPRTKAAFDELFEAGFLELVPEGELPRNGKGWKGTKKLSDKIREFKKPTPEESFPVTTE